jgi:GcrA cell cycle regulator
MRATAKKAAKPKTLLDLEPGDCRWPIGEPKHDDFHFCGKPHAPGRPYCAHHWRLAFQTPPPRLRKKPWPESGLALASGSCPNAVVGASGWFIHAIGGVGSRTPM